MDPLPLPQLKRSPRVTDPAATRRRVVALALPGGDPLELVGPLEILGTANMVLESAGRPDLGYDFEVAAPAKGVILEWKGLKLIAERACHELRGPIDTLIVQAMDISAAGLRERRMLRWLARVAPRIRRVASVCSGTYVLAEAGLLDGRRATTHWAFCDDFARRYPRVRVDPEPIFVQDGNLYTSAGATAGLDLTLAFVEQDFGREVALRVAQYLVFFLKRPGNQAQFSVQMASQLAERDVIRDVQTYVYENLDADLSVLALAKRAAMSPRNFARVFAEQVGVTPGRFVEDARQEIARERLEQSKMTVDEIAAACGYHSAETMRQAFVRSLGVSPSEYRRRFASAVGPVRNGAAPAEIDS
jgi:transcriptional regulator GlxA family with amidase domain